MFLKMKNKIQDGQFVGLLPEQRRRFPGDTYPPGVARSYTDLSLTGILKQDFVFH
jgi:hypothetical protein